MNLRYTINGCLALAVVLLTMNLSLTALAQDEEAQVVNREYHLKAAFLFHFTSFIGWPDGALGDEFIEVGVLGQDPFGDALDTIDGKVVQGRTIVVKRSRSTEELSSCAVLFIARSEQAQLQEIVSKVGHRPVLTVSEIKGFAHQWGVINFETVGNRVRFEINNEAAKRSRLQISSRLLKVSTIVDDLHQATARR